MQKTAVIASRETGMQRARNCNQAGGEMLMARAPACEFSAAALHHQGSSSILTGANSRRSRR